MRRSLALGGTLLVLLLSACATQQPQIPGDTSWAEHQASVAQFDTWTAFGKLALRTPEMAESASMEWHQREGNTLLQLSGPLGVNATTIAKQGNTFSITQGEDRRELDLSDPQALQRQTGWDLPLAALPHWLKGVPAPALEVQLLELEPHKPGLLQTLRQDDWEIRYQEYGRFEQLTLPVRLQIQRGTTSVRVIIRAWATGAAQ